MNSLFILKVPWVAMCPDGYSRWKITGRETVSDTWTEAEGRWGGGVSSKQSCALKAMATSSSVLPDHSTLHHIYIISGPHCQHFKNALLIMCAPLTVALVSPFFQVAIFQKQSPKLGQITATLPQQGATGTGQWMQTTKISFLHTNDVSSTPKTNK